MFHDIVTFQKFAIFSFVINLMLIQIPRLEFFSSRQKKAKQKISQHLSIKVSVKMVMKAPKFKHDLKFAF